MTNHKIKFKLNEYYKTLLFKYYPSLINSFTFAFLFEPEDLEVVKDISAELEYSLAPSIEQFEKFNKLIGKGLNIPIGQYENCFAFLKVENKKHFLYLLDLDNPYDIYFDCPFLIALIRDSIELTIHEITNPKKEIKNTTINIHNTISMTLCRLLLPDVSFFNSIANFNYEGQENKGYIYFYRDFENTTKNIIFKNPELISRMDSKLIRKLLEMTNEQIGLLCFLHMPKNRNDRLGWQVIGLGKAVNQPFATVHFSGSSKWSMRFNAEEIIYDGKEYKLRHIYGPEFSDIINKNEIEKIKQFYDYTGIGKQKFNSCINALRKLIEQKHGTMLIVSNEAGLEADRFCNAKRGIRIKNKNINKIDNETLINLSSIDGAILIDPNCNCYALGIIVDGYIYPDFEGDSGRGARFNSAKLYIHNIKHAIQNGILNVLTGKTPEHAMAIVISEDGYLDVFSSTELITEL